MKQFKPATRKGGPSVGTIVRPQPDGEAEAAASTSDGK